MGRGEFISQREKNCPADSGMLLPDFKGARLLLVEDNDINREFAIELLGTVNIKVDVAKNGEEALAMIQEQTYDCVLMDVQMPVMDGLEATRRIRALKGEYFASLPIVAMTALAMNTDAEESHAAGMNDHIAKPVKPERLFSCLSKYLPNAATDSPLEKAIAYRISPTPIECPPEFLKLQNLQVEEGLRRIGGKAEAYYKQLLRFKEHYANAVAELERLLGENLPAAETYCHTLKGVVGNIGAQALLDCIINIDILLKQKQLPSAADLQRMRDKLQLVISDVDSLAATPFQSSAAKQALTRQDAIPLITQLQELLENDLGAAETLLTKLQLGLEDSEYAADINEIVAQIDIFNIDHARSLLTAMQSRLSAVP
jgi:CheY-like chemotaxis protein